MTVDNCHDNSQKAQTRTKKESCINSRSKPCPCSWITHEYSSHSFPNPSLLPWPSYICGVCLNWVEELICELGSCFSVLCPLNKACAVPVSTSVLLFRIRSEKEPLWPRQGVSTQAKTLVYVWLTSLVIEAWRACQLSQGVWGLLCDQRRVILNNGQWVRIFEN